MLRWWRERRARRAEADRRAAELREQAAECDRQAYALRLESRRARAEDDSDWRWVKLTALAAALEEQAAARRAELAGESQRAAEHEREAAFYTRRALEYAGMERLRVPA